MAATKPNDGKSALEKALKFSRAILFGGLEFSVASIRAKDENGPSLTTGSQERKIYELAEILGEARGLEWVRNYFPSIQICFYDEGVYKLDGRKWVLSDNAAYVVARVEDAAQIMAGKWFAMAWRGLPLETLYAALREDFSKGENSFLDLPARMAIKSAFWMYSGMTSSDDRYMLLYAAAEAGTLMGKDKFRAAYKSACGENDVKNAEVLGCFDRLLDEYSATQHGVLTRNGEKQYGISEFGMHIIETVSKLEKPISELEKRISEAYGD